MAHTDEQNDTAANRPFRLGFIGWILVGIVAGAVVSVIIEAFVWLAFGGAFGIVFGAIFGPKKQQ